MLIVYYMINQKNNILKNERKIKNNTNDNAKKFRRR